ncbi:MAG TPA: insulinase family protein, partial [Mucilaginibacter sp.]
GIIQYAIYGKENPFNNQLTKEELNVVTASQLTDLLHELFHYPHSINYYGPVTMPRIKGQIAKLHFLPASFIPVPASKTFSKISQNANEVLFRDYDMVQAEVYWVRNTDTYNPDQTASIDVFNNYFGGGMGSVIFQAIRESKALAYSTFAQYTSPARKNERYSAIAYVGTQADKMKDAIATMNDLLNVLPENPSLLINSRQSIRQDIAAERIQPQRYISRYLAALKLGLDGDQRKNVYEKIDQVSYPELKRFDDKYLANKPYTYCIMGSEKKISEKDLQSYGTLKKLSLEQIFGY